MLQATPTRSIKLSWSCRVTRLDVDQDVRGLQIAVRERSIVQRANESASETSGSGSGLGGPPARGRQHLAGVGRQVDDVVLLDGDQVGLVRQEPEERVTP